MTSDINIFIGDELISKNEKLLFVQVASDKCKLICTKSANRYIDSAFSNGVSLNRIEEAVGFKFLQVIKRGKNILCNADEQKKVYYKFDDIQYIGTCNYVLMNTEVCLGDVLTVEDSHVGIDRKLLFAQINSKDNKLIDIKTGNRYSDYLFDDIESIKNIQRIINCNVKAIKKKNEVIKIPFMKKSYAKIGDVISTNIGDFFVSKFGKNILLVNTYTGRTCYVEWLENMRITFEEIEKVMREELNVPANISFKMEGFWRTGDRESC